jgi:hypothetical protein
MDPVTDLPLEATGMHHLTIMVIVVGTCPNLAQTPRRRRAGTTAGWEPRSKVAGGSNGGSVGRTTSPSAAATECSWLNSLKDPPMIQRVNPGVKKTDRRPSTLPDDKPPTEQSQASAWS